MELEWRTTDKNTVFDECDVCHYKRPVKEMMIPEYKDIEPDEDDEFEDFFQFYCFGCYKQAELDEEFWREKDGQ